MVGNQRHIRREQKDLVVVMSARKTPKEIAADTMMDVGTVRRTLRLWRTTGSTRILTALEVDASSDFSFCVGSHAGHWNPDKPGKWNRWKENSLNAVHGVPTGITLPTSLV
ncbi:hypothetical protein B0H14DRAFT_2620917 [Mycena olivaceomarginata]|nr:hypothetical protein B0H14DRAFT_2620917 [Mycena olivaceomarginata]